MGEDIGKETALEIAKDYADEDCVGELGEILDVTEEESLWIVELRTHTFDDSYDHRLKITTAVGNLISHERNDRLE